MKLFRFLRGSVTFEATGGFSERFLNLCNLRGIILYQPKSQHHTLTATVSRSDYHALRTVARQSGMHLTAKKKEGLPFLMKKYQARLALPIAAAAFAVLAVVLSGCVWSIETTGSEQLSGEEIMSVMDTLGLRVGIRKHSIDTSLLSQQAMQLLSGRVKWLGVNISGSRAVVEVHDYIDRGEDETFGEPSNVLADFDGYLLSLEVHNGEAVAKVGSGVKTGDLLISGVTEDRNGFAHFYDARGVATAVHTDTLTRSAPKAEPFQTYSRVRKVRAFRLFHLAIPLGVFPVGGRFDVFRDASYLEAGSVSLPIGIETQTRCYYGENRTADSFLPLLDDFTRSADNAYRNTLLLQTNLIVQADGDSTTLTAVNECIDFIGKRQIIHLENDERPH